METLLQSSSVDHVFISYNRADKDFAGQMMLRFQMAGLDTWMDNTGLRGGQDWSAEIDRAITEARAVVVVMSPEAKASEYVTYEWSFAIGAGVPVIPVLVKQTELHPRLARIQYRNFTHDVRPWDDLINDLRDLASSKGLSNLRIPRDAPPHVKRAITALDSASSDERRDAIEILADANYSEVHSILTNALRHPIAQVRLLASLKVVPFDPERAIPTFIETMPPSQSWITNDMVKRMVKAGVIHRFIELIDKEGIEKRALAADDLSMERVEEAIPLFINWSKDSSASIRALGVYSLRYSSRSDVVAALIERLSDFDKILDIYPIPPMGERICDIARIFLEVCAERGSREAQVAIAKGRQKRSGGSPEKPQPEATQVTPANPPTTK